MGEAKPAVDLSRYRIGLIGTGLMGAPMARRLAAAGALLVLWNRTIETAERLAADLPNAEPVPSPRHAADRSDIVIVMVTDADAVETVVFDPMDDSYGVAHGIGDGGLVIDMSTTDVARTQEFADRLRARGAEWIDAPVSGGTTAAEDGTLSIMVGGSDGGFARAEPVFRALGARITHVGAVGAGQIAKTANQMIVGMTIGAVAEAFALARSAGLSPGRSARRSLAGSRKAAFWNCTVSGWSTRTSGRVPARPSSSRICGRRHRSQRRSGSTCPGLRRILGSGNGWWKTERGISIIRP